jgi:hypothetical protein
LSLPELIFGMSVFMLFLGGVFGLFTRGYQSFHFLQTRQSLQGEFLRIKSILQADFGRTHLRSIGIDPRTINVDGESLRRDQACCLILEDWASSDSYSPDMGLPLWDRHVIYRASTDTASTGSLERLNVAPPDLPLPYRIRPLEGFATIVDEGVVNRQLLTSLIRSFECQVDPAMQQVRLAFELEGVGSKRGLDQTKVKERFQAEFQWLPSNTVPRF